MKSDTVAYEESFACAGNVTYFYFDVEENLNNHITLILIEAKVWIYRCLLPIHGKITELIRLKFCKQVVLSLE